MHHLNPPQWKMRGLYGKKGIIQTFKPIQSFVGCFNEKKLMITSVRIGNLTNKWNDVKEHTITVAKI